MDLSALSPTALVQLRQPPSPDPRARAKFRGQVRRQVRTCHACRLRDHQPKDSNPIAFEGPREPAFVVVNEAPGPEEFKRGRPFIGPAAKILRALFTEADIDPDDVMYVNTVSCFPNVDGKVRAPIASETSFCRANLLAQIEAAYCPYVLLVGAGAFGAFRGDLSITKHHGRLFLWNELYAVMGIVHPSAILRGQRHYKEKIREDLRAWREVVYGGDDPTVLLSTACVKCGDEMARWDRDGVPYCTHHWRQWGESWKTERTKWNTKIEQLTF